jgi:hypothetical protein
MSDLNYANFARRWMAQHPGQMYSPGNIDLNNRPIALNPDGTISTIRSISVDQGGRTYLLPTVINGRVVSNQRAIRHFQRTNKSLGAFASPEAADAYGEVLHQLQARQYAAQADQIRQGNRFHHGGE